MGFLFIFFSSFSQNGFTIVGKNKVTTIPFELKNNLILIPIEINEQKFTFILDTGVSKTLLFNIKANDSIQLNNRQKIKIKGLGANEYYSAIKSDNNFVKIKNIIHPKAEIYLITEAKFDFSNRLGKDIHGLIGADLIKNFVVEINYTKKKLKFYSKNTFTLKRKKKWKPFPITIYNNKPYVSTFFNDKNINLLLDSGSGDALWLYEDADIKIPPKNFEDFLGNGLSGEIHGKKAKIPLFNLKDFSLKKVLVSYPDSLFIPYIKSNYKRNGIIGGEILKRFHVIFDYQNKLLYLKKNSNFNKPFWYNKTGLEIAYNGKILVKEDQFKLNTSEAKGNNSINFLSVIKYIFKDSYIITSVKEGSSADKVGLQKGDLIKKINGQNSYTYKLEEITEKLSNNKKKIVLVIERNGIEYKFVVPMIDYL